jgi:sec-independent protein translocase protein TatB
MFDIGFWELLVIAIVLLLVMGPERLPEVARQAAFLVRKARQGMFRLRNEMQSEMDATPFADLQKARQEMTDLKNDFKQFGRELADSAEQKRQANSEPASASNGSSTKVKGPNLEKGSADGGADQPAPDAGAGSVPATQAGDMPADDSVGKQR